MIGKGGGGRIGHGSQSRSLSTQFQTIGTGGVEAELLQDTATLVLPASRAALRHALASLRLAARLSGFRGRPAADTEAALNIIERLVQAFSNEPDCSEIDRKRPWPERRHEQADDHQAHRRRQYPLCLLLCSHDHSLIFNAETISTRSTSRLTIQPDISAAINTASAARP